VKYSLEEQKRLIPRLRDKVVEAAKKKAVLPCESLHLGPASRDDMVDFFISSKPRQVP
jgi:hypothetical protein